MDKETLEKAKVLDVELYLADKAIADWRNMELRHIGYYGGDLMNSDFTIPLSEAVFNQMKEATLRELKDRAKELEWQLEDL